MDSGLRRTHTPLMLRFEMLRSTMLNTKFDESLEIITMRYAGHQAKYTTKGKMLMPSRCSLTTSLE